MRRVLALALLAAGLFSTPAHAQRVAEKPPSLVPFWLPREISIQTFFNNGNVTPELRLAWHIPVVQQRIDSLNLIVEGGGGYALGKRSTFDDQSNPPLIHLHQWHIHGGVSYEGDWAQGWHVGARVTTGVTLFGGRYDLRALGQGVIIEGTESAATVEGRVEGGYRLGRVVVGLAFGVLQPWSKSPNLYSVNDIGGISGGVFLNWR